MREPDRPYGIAHAVGVCCPDHRCDPASKTCRDCGADCTKCRYGPCAQGIAGCEHHNDGRASSVCEGCKDGSEFKAKVVQHV